MNKSNNILVVYPNNTTLNSNPLLSDIQEHNIIYMISHANIIENILIIKPSLIIFIDLLTYDFCNVCSTLRNNCDTKNIPVIFIDNSNSSTKPCKIFEAGATDYIKTPIDTKVFKFKINNYIQLYSSITKLQQNALYAKELNPNTCLPGNTAIKNNIIEALHSNKNFVITYTDLDNFKAYNDKYGFDRGDEVLKLTANIINNHLKNIDDFTFLGHIGGDDFVFIVPKSHINNIAFNIITSFDLNIKNYYDAEDIKKGYIISESRRGNKEKYPIMTISLGSVDLSNTISYEETINRCTDVKKHAKTYQKSCFVLDERKSNTFVEDYITSFSSAVVY
jgi:diguanylate cyclase (GGDEF)-like protein